MNASKIALLACLLSSNACNDRDSASKTITVAVASSLADPIKELAAAYMQKNPSQRVYLNIGSSSFLETQIRFRADTDLFLAAHPEHIKRLEAEHLLRNRQPLLSNTLVVLCAKGVDDAEDLASLISRDSTKHLALALKSVPVGYYADAVLRNLGLDDALKGKVTYADSARSVVNQVEQGGAELGIVHKTDANKLKHAHTCLSIDEKLHPPIVYEIAEVRNGADKESLASAFSAYLASDGKAIFAKYGFGKLTDAL